MRINIWMVLAVLLALSPLGSCNLSNKRNASAPIPERLGVPNGEKRRSNRGKWPTGKIKFEGNSPYALPMVHA